jgi:hypothetical protein
METQLAPVAGMLMISACTVPNARIKVMGNNSDFLSRLIDTISKSDKVKVEVLESKPDESQENSPKEEPTQGVLSFYREKVKDFSKSIDEAFSLSGVLLKTKLPRTMWGAKDVEKVLTKIRANSEDILSQKESFEIAAEQTEHKIGTILALAGRGLDPQRRGIIATATDHIEANFFTMKKLMSMFLLANYQLYSINQMFKKFTGYPATWFFDPSVFYSFTERFEDLCDHMIDAGRAEAKVIQPLHAWKEKICTGV